MISIRPAAAQDWPAVAALLSESGLPLDGARQHLDAFILAIEAGVVIGTAGMEVSEGVGLLRSVAVAVQARGRALAKLLLQGIVEQARRRQVVQLFLLTTTASEYFAGRGFVALARDEAPALLRSSAEFNGACPLSATLMMLPLTA